MELLLGWLRLTVPRLAFVVVWLAGGDSFRRVFDNALWPTLGFVFLPLTTLALVYLLTCLGATGQVPAVGWALMAVAFTCDMGLLRGRTQGVGPALRRRAVGTPPREQRSARAVSPPRDTRPLRLEEVDEAPAGG